MSNKLQTAQDIFEWPYDTSFGGGFWRIRVFKDGAAWCCVGEGFKDLQESDNYAFGDTRDEAIAAYGKIMQKVTP